MIVASWLWLGLWLWLWLFLCLYLCLLVWLRLLLWLWSLDDRQSACRGQSQGLGQVLRCSTEFPPYRLQAGLEMRSVLAFACRCACVSAQDGV